MNSYEDNLKVKDALEIYFSRYGFDADGYTAKWFKIKLGRISFPLPNIKSRVDAVKIHDLHHLLTEYEATNKGEAEIGAWELASGCEKYSPAWLLNLGSFLVGMFICPRLLLRAFLRGRRASSNLYYGTVYDENLLNRTIGDLRHEMDVNSTKKNSTKDYVLFILCCIIALAYHIGMLLLFFFGLKALFLFLF